MDPHNSISARRDDPPSTLPIDLPAIDSFADPLRPVLTTGDMIAFVIGILGTLCGGALVWWIFA